MRLEDRDGTLWIRLAGEIDNDGTGPLAETFREAALGASGPVVVDLGDVRFVSSNGLRMLLATQHALRREDRGLRVAHLPPHIRKVFATIRLFDAIPEYGPDETADA